VASFRIALAIPTDLQGAKSVYELHVHADLIREWHQGQELRRNGVHGMYMAAAVLLCCCAAVLLCCCVLLRCGVLLCCCAAVLL
jgi:hypothetical protein